MKKPNGMCTIACDVKKKTVTLGFLTSEQAQKHRDYLIDVTIESTMGMGRKMHNLNFTPEELETATAQTIIESIEAVRHQADLLDNLGAPTAAQVLREHATQMEKDINESLGRPTK